MRKLFGNVGVVFKGSGFYRTDSRGTNSDTVPAKKTEGATAKEGAAAKTESAPATTSSTPTNTSSGSSSSAPATSTLG
jgi:predicted nucleic acid-binding Zn ribbon protein